MLVAEMIGVLIVEGSGIALLLFADIWSGLKIWIIIFMIAILIIGLISPKIRYERYRYRITDEEIDIQEGFLWINRNIVPIERLHKIEVARGPIDRMFGLAKVSVTTAGGDVTLRFLDNEKADFIADSLKKRINEEAADAKEYLNSHREEDAQ